MTMPTLTAFNFNQWISANQDKLKPPVGTYNVFPAGDMMVMVVGGPNERTDYHSNPTGELFYQLKGNMYLNIMAEAGQPPTQVHIKEGEILYLPPRVLHSPQRPEAGSVGLLVEVKRRPEQEDGLEWFCGRCHHLVFSRYGHLSNIPQDLKDTFDVFYGDAALRVCPNCGDVHPGKFVAAN